MVQLLFGASFAAGFVAGLAGYFVKRAARNEAEAVNNPGFNPSYSGNGGGSQQTGSPTPSNAQNPFVFEWPSPPTAEEFQQNLVDQANAFTQEQAWWSYNQDTAGNWIPWSQYVANLQSQEGIDWSGFETPPGGAEDANNTDSWLEDYI